MAYLVAGVAVEADELITIAVTCKYMGWTYDEYQAQPRSFIQTVIMLRQAEAEEAKRQQNYGSNN